MLKDFKEFIIKGNMMDMAVGIIMGGAFGLAVKALVDHIIMPIVAGIFKLPDFSEMYYAFKEGSYASLEKAQEAGAVIAYGAFINTIINLLIVGFAIFMMVKIVTNMQKKKEEEPEEDPAPTEVDLLTEIRDQLKKQNG